MFDLRRRQFITLLGAAAAIRYAVPAIYQYRDFAAAGGLMSYGGKLWRQRY